MATIINLLGRPATIRITSFPDGPLFDVVKGPSKAYLVFQDKEFRDFIEIDGTQMEVIPSSHPGVIVVENIGRGDSHFKQAVLSQPIQGVYYLVSMQVFMHLCDQRPDLLALVDELSTVSQIRKSEGFSHDG